MLKVIGISAVMVLAGLTAIGVVGWEVVEAVTLFFRFTMTGLGSLLR
jgi:hypothetical protein